MDLADAITPKTTLYIIENSRSGTDVVGTLLTAAGEAVHGHTSSSPQWLRADLTENFGRAEQLKERFGDFTVVYVSLDDELPAEIAHHFATLPAGEGPTSCLP